MTSNHNEASSEHSLSFVPKHGGGALRPWQPGQSGNPGGRRKDLISAALRRRIESDPELLEKLVDQFVRLALSPNGKTPHHVRLAALESIRDSTEGRPRQAVEVMEEDSGELRGLLEDMKAALTRTKPA